MKWVLTWGVAAAFGLLPMAQGGDTNDQSARVVAQSKSPVKCATIRDGGSISVTLVQGGKKTEYMIDYGMDSETRGEIFARSAHKGDVMLSPGEALAFFARVRVLLEEYHGKEQLEKMLKSQLPNAMDVVRKYGADSSQWVDYCERSDAQSLLGLQLSEYKRLHGMLPVKE